MRHVYFSENGDDDNDGLSEATPIYSWARYLKMKSADDCIVILRNPKRVMRRLTAEIEEQKKKRHA